MTKRHALPALMVALIAAPAAMAQSTGAIPPVAEQVAAAVLPLPADMQAGAMVMGYKVKDKLETLRPGTNGMICLALYVSRPDFHVACYNKGLEPFMVRGREIRAKMGAKANVDSIRFKEIADGTLKMPKQGALYSLSGKKEGWDPRTGKVSGASPLNVIYMPFATVEETGLSAVPQKSGPWLMLPGTAKAHLMLAGTMTP
jgi:hypothetical protein